MYDGAATLQRFKCCAYGAQDSGSYPETQRPAGVRATRADGEVGTARRDSEHALYDGEPGSARLLTKQMSIPVTHQTGVRRFCPSHFGTENSGATREGARGVSGADFLPSATSHVTPMTYMISTKSLSIEALTWRALNLPF